MSTAAERRRRVLLVIVELRVPPVSGRERRYCQHIAALRATADVGVLLLDRRRNSSGAPDGVAWWRRTAVAWIGDQVGWVRRPDGHPDYGQPPAEALEALDGALEEFDPDDVVVGGLWLHRHLDRIRRPGRRLVLDAADVEGPLLEDLAGVTAGGERVLRRVLARHVAQIEGQAVRSADQIWVCSNHDAGVLASRYPGAAPVTVVPNTVDTGSLLRPATEQRPAAPTVVFPATFGYAPNDSAALTLVRRIHPLVRRRFADATLSLVGAGASAELRAAVAPVAGVELVGPVTDVRPWLWGSTVLAAPLTIGSGTRIKLLEAFAAGLPVVTTAKGAEGLDVVDGTHVLMAESPSQFAEAIAFLHDEPTVGPGLADRARHLVEARYSTAAARQAVESALAWAPAPAP
jgi:glycosyltransferase involved in cell wall biosynthesis